MRYQSTTLRLAAGLVEKDGQAAASVVSLDLAEKNELLVVILGQRRRGKQLICRRCLEHRQAQDLWQLVQAMRQPRDADQMLRRIGVDPPGPHRVGVGQRVACHRRAETPVIQPRVLRRQGGFDVAQALAKCQLPWRRTDPDTRSA